MVVLNECVYCSSNLYRNSLLKLYEAHYSVSQCCTMSQLSLLYIYIVLDQLVQHIVLLSAMTQSYGMQLKKQELLTLIRSGEESIRLRSKPPGLGFFYIVSERVLQSGWIYCSICDKLLKVESRMSVILSRHSRSKLHNKLLKLLEERRAGRNSRTHMITNEALAPPIGEQHQNYLQPIRYFVNLDY